MVDFNEENYLAYKAYIRKKSKLNPNFAIQDCFSIEEEERKGFVVLMDEIDKINIEIKNTKKRAEKNALSRRKGKLLEELSNRILSSADIFAIKENLRDHTNEIDLLLTPSDYNKLNADVLPEYLKEDIIIECKNYNNKIENDWVGKFFSLLTTHKTKVGIIFSYYEFKGLNDWNAAKGLVRKLYLAEDVFIININFDDIKQHIINDKKNIVELIISKYNGLKHSASYKEFISTHPAEIKE